MNPVAPVSPLRRSVLAMGVTFPFLMAASSAVQANEPRPITVDVSDVTDVPSLIRAIRRAAGGLLPASFRDEEFYAGLAKAFVEKARAAAELGYSIPKWVLDRLPKRNVALELLGVVVLVYLGIKFLVAVAIVVRAVLVSMLIMSAVIWLALELANAPDPETTKT